jgi:hypothetical protein
MSPELGNTTHLLGKMHETFDIFCKSTVAFHMVDFPIHLDPPANLVEE